MAAWPERQAGLTVERAGAQTAEKQAESQALASKSEFDKEAQATKQKLQKSINTRFDQTPIRDCLKFISDECGVEIYEDSKTLSEAGIDTSTSPVTISLPRVRSARLLELVLDTAGLDYFIDNDGIICVNTKDQLDTALTLQIYDCRKILADAAASGNTFAKSTWPRRPPHVGGRMDGSPDSPHAEQAAGNHDGVQSKPAKQTTPGAQLIEVVTGTIATQTWNSFGGPGTICEYGGLLVVSQTREVHEEIADLLERLGEKLAVPADD